MFIIWTLLDGLFFFALSLSSREDVLPPFKMKLNRPMDEMFKGQDTIPLNVHGTVMMTSRQTLELLVSEGKKNEMEVNADLSCLETILNQVKDCEQNSKTNFNCVLMIISKSIIL